MNLRIITLATAAVLSPLSNSMVFAQDAAQARPADIEQLRSEMRLNEPLSKDALAECEEAVRQLFTIESISKQYGEGNDPASRPYAFAPLKCTVTFDGMQEPLAIVATPRPGLKRLPKSDRGNGVLPVFSQRNAQVFVSITERTRIKANALRKVDSVPVLFESNPQSMAGARAFLDATKAINTRAAKVPRGWRKHIGQFRSVNKVRGIDGFYEFSTPEEVFLEGIIRENGKIIIPPVYDEVDLIENGFILRTEDNTYGLAALDGQTVLPVEYKSISDQGDGRLQVYDKDQKYSVYDANERAFLGDRYDDLDFIKDANLVVVENDGVHRFLTRDMNSAFDATFSRVMRLTNDRFIVTAEGVYSMIDQTGNPLIPAAYDSLWPHSKHRLIFARSSDGTAYFNYDGQQISPQGWNVHYAPSTEKGYVTVSDPEGRYGVIYPTGEFAIPAEYAQIHQFNEGYAPVAKVIGGRKLFGLLDEAGRQVIPFAYDNLQLVRDERLWARKNGKWGLIDVNETVITDFMFDQMSRFEKVWDPETRQDTRLMVAKKDGLFGIVRHDTGEVVVPFTYEEARPYSLELRKGDEWVRYRCIVKPELEQCKPGSKPAALTIPSPRRPD